MDWMPQAIREGLFTILFISGPLVVLAAALGLAIGIIQAATQVQEQTLASAVKIIGLFLALIIFGFYMFQYLRQYTSDNLQRAFKLVPSLGSYIKPRNNFLTRKPPSEELLPPSSPAELNPENLPAKGAPKIAGDILNQPDQVPVNVGKPSPDSLGKPASQVRTENPNIKKQEMVKPVAQTPAKPVAQQVAPKPAPVAAKPVAQQVAPKPAPAPAPARPVAQQTTPKPAPTPAKPVTQQAPKPAPAAAPAEPAEPAITVREQPRTVEPERKSINDALNRIRNNFNQPAGAGTP